jgi:hypothetical protein
MMQKAKHEVDDKNGLITGVPFSPNIAFPAEEEILISYGDKGNEEWLYLLWVCH